MRHLNNCRRTSHLLSQTSLAGKTRQGVGIYWVKDLPPRGTPSKIKVLRDMIWPCPTPFGGESSVFWFRLCHSTVDLSHAKAISGHRILKRNYRCMRCGSKLKSQDNAGVSLCFHLPRVMLVPFFERQPHFLLFTPETQCTHFSQVW